MVIELNQFIEVEQREIPQIDLVLLYYLDYYNPRYLKTDRKVALNENVMQTMGQLILSCVNNEMDFYIHCQVMQSSSVASKLLNCIEFQMITLGG